MSTPAPTPLVGLSPLRVELSLRAPAKRRLANGIEIYTPCREVSTPDKTVFVLGLSGLDRYGHVSAPAVGPYPPLVTLALYTRTQTISNKAMELGFQHRVGRCRPGILSLSSPGCSSYGDTEGFLKG